MKTMKVQFDPVIDADDHPSNSSNSRNEDRIDIGERKHDDIQSNSHASTNRNNASAKE